MVTGYTQNSSMSPLSGVPAGGGALPGRSAAWWTAAAAAALGLGVTGFGLTSAQAAPAGGAGPCTVTTSGDEQAAEHNGSAWKDEHGTAPVGHTYSEGAGRSGTFAQEGPGAETFRLSVPSADAERSAQEVDAPEGVYEVLIGDGECGTVTQGRVEDGVLDLSGEQLLSGKRGDQMVQVRGPLTEEAAEGAAGDEKRYVGRDGSPSEFPQVEAGTGFSAEKTLSLLVSAEAVQAGSPHGVPTYRTGLEKLTFNPSSTAADPAETNAPVQVSYRDARTGDLVTVDSGASWSRNSAGETTLEGGVLPELPSGRYTFSYVDEEGDDVKFFVMLGDGEQHGTPDNPLYADPF